MVKKSIIVIILSCAVFSSYAGTTYTQEQIRGLVEAGNPPKEKPADVISSKQSPFSKCKPAAEKIYSKERIAKVIEDREDTYIIKVWAFDGSVTFKCANGYRALSGAAYE
ncbi:hypothetical protein EC835_101708 [Providencia alcalifaciens]|jgi:hypothetical protein|uniref:Uncharacterized protein n=1 Tax=Providencia alcalifaciens TaxID=126385 RepID=A0A4R3NX60_9GAMM|nr:hypothetical protein [Providencia alcalifaciens]TCT38686.1 hypothetical protein EC835_101708 [Providencia alcalifaciens]